MFPRKILPKIHFLCVLALVKSQNYEYSSDEGDTESDVEGDSRPDYSKYYSVAPKDGGLTLAGFIQPDANFGFGPYESAFGASNAEKQKLIPTQPFVPIVPKPAEEPNAAFAAFFTKNLFPGNQPQDYFEQSQSRQHNKQEKEDERSEEPSEEVSEESEEENEEAEEKVNYDRPGPNYISREVPAKIPHQVETVSVPENERNNRFHDYPKEIIGRDYKDHHKPLANNNYVAHAQQEPLTPLQFSQVYPQASGYQRLTQTPVAPLTPYQKYSFKPVAEYQNKYLENLNAPSNVKPNYGTKFPRIPTSPYQAQQSRIVPRSAGKKNCRKMKRNSGDDNIGDLTCYVCENAETNSKVTECSYQSEPDSTDSHKGNSERYSVPAKKPDGFRYRREASGEDDSDPYEYVRSKSLAAENEKQDDGEYNYEGYEESQPEKSYSEIQSEEILKDPKKCTDVERDGMSCRVCKDPASGGNYESCSFTRAPTPEKYAYVSEKNYDSNDDPEYASEGDESKNVPTNSKPGTESKDKPSKEKKSYSKERKNGKKYSKTTEYKYPKGSKSEYSDYEYPKKPEQKGPDDEYTQSKGEKSKYNSFSYPKYEAETKHEPKVVKNTEEESSDSKNASTDDEVSPYKDIDEYQFKYFPEHSNQESQNKEEPLNYDASSRKEVEDVLADFQKRDRSQCKQTKKNGMTCFLCVDENKVKNEECMFISESRPKGTIAKYSKTDEEVVSPTEKKPVVYKKITKGTKKPFGAKTSKKTDKIEAAASSEVETVVSPPSKRKHKKASKSSELKASASAIDSQRIEEKEDDPKIETPTEFQTSDEGGAYSAETKPVYSKTLGMTLPQYMLAKSEFEKEFDAFSAHE